MGYGTPTDIPAIYNAIAVKLVTTDTRLNASQLKFTLASDRDLDQLKFKDRSLFIRPGRFQVDREEQKGSGRTYGIPADGTLDLILYSRLWTGEILDDLDAIQDASRGILTFWKTLLDSLEQFTPLNAAGDCLLREPLRLLAFGLEIRHTEKPGWTRLNASCSAKYVQALS